MSRFHTTDELTAQEWRSGRPGVVDIVRLAPDETPIGISYNDRAHAVVMARPRTSRTWRWASP